jgi:hypothetical protein
LEIADAGNFRGARRCGDQSGVTVDDAADDLDLRAVGNVRYRRGGAEDADVELAGNNGVQAVGGILEFGQIDVQSLLGEQTLFLGDKEFGVAGDRQIADLERFSDGTAHDSGQGRDGQQTAQGLQRSPWFLLGRRGSGMKCNARCR